MVVLRIRGFPDDQHRFKTNVLYLIWWLLGVCLLLTPQIGLYERNLNLFRADLSKKDLRNVNLIKANLSEADLTGADLRKAKLWKANLRGADLSYADLQQVELVQPIRLFIHTASAAAKIVRGFMGEGPNEDDPDPRVDQICEAKTLYKAKLDPELEKLIKENCSDKL